MCPPPPIKELCPPLCQTNTPPTLCIPSSHTGLSSQLDLQDLLHWARFTGCPARLDLVINCAIFQMKKKNIKKKKPCYLKSA